MSEDSVKDGISIVIVNFNTAEMTADCIASVHRTLQNLKYEIIVVDNHSSDNSRQVITESFPETVWIQNEQNEGFGRANNRGIRQARYDIVLLLNSDTIVGEGSIENFYTSFTSEPKHVGIAGCQLLNPDGTRQVSTFSDYASYRQILASNLILDKLFGLFKTEQVREKRIRALHGACLIFDKARLAETGYFDPDFFLYFEEIEWCHRLTRKGFDLTFYEDIEVVHIDAGSQVKRSWNLIQRNVSNALLFKKIKGRLSILMLVLLHGFNFLCNLLMLWKMTPQYRSDFWLYQRNFWKPFPYYMRILTGKYRSPLKVEYNKYI